MTTLTLSQIEERVRKNTIRYNNTIESFIREVNGSKKNKGRVRPKHPTEAKILSLFKKK
jgi:hypothetical protein